MMYSLLPVKAEELDADFISHGGAIDDHSIVLLFVFTARLLFMLVIMFRTLEQL